jgi:hypothetical protein
MRFKNHHRMGARKKSPSFVLPRQSPSGVPDVKHDNLAVFDRIKNGVVEASNIFAAHALFLRLLSLEWKLSNLLHGSLDGIGELRND